MVSNSISSAEAAKSRNFSCFLIEPKSLRLNRLLDNSEICRSAPRHLLYYFFVFLLLHNCFYFALTSAFFMSNSNIFSL